MSPERSSRLPREMLVPRIDMNPGGTASCYDGEVERKEPGILTPRQPSHRNTQVLHVVGSEIYLVISRVARRLRTRLNKGSTLYMMSSIEAYDDMPCATARGWHDSGETVFLCRQGVVFSPLDRVVNVLIGLAEKPPSAKGDNQHTAVLPTSQYTPTLEHLR